MDDQRINPFQLSVPQQALDDLHDRLARTRWPDELPGADWTYGVPLGYLKDLADYWRTGYDWRRQEVRLNEFPQFTTTIDGTRVHFIHARSPEAGAIPLIITHGWPGLIAEFLHHRAADRSARMAATRWTPSTSSYRPSPASGYPDRHQSQAGTCTGSRWPGHG